MPFLNTVPLDLYRAAPSLVIPPELGYGEDGAANGLGMSSLPVVRAASSILVQCL
ncbi:MAG: hypothetical protein LBF83_10995 [Spirochaetaceae bacterium]|nr:hypothetical protein [Spirochaetaceae bacterium]